MTRKLILILFLLIFFSCEEEVSIDLPESGGKMVVEGKIEKGMPPIVYLTETISFFSSVSIAKIQNSYIHNAEIIINNGDTSIKLKEYRSDSIRFILDSLPPLFKIIFGSTLPEFLLQNNDSNTIGNISFIFYFYTVDYKTVTFSSMFLGEEGKQYFLTIKNGNQTLNAVTTIPFVKKLDSLWFKFPENPLNDSDVILWTRFTDPEAPGNNYRYFTRRNKESFYSNPYGSVFDDHLINGKSLSFSIGRGRNRNEEIEHGTGSVFQLGDTVTVKWCTIDMAHYSFWRSLEADRRSVGNPFGSPTIIESNIEGGLGVWGGYGVVLQTIVLGK